MYAHVHHMFASNHNNGQWQDKRNQERLCKKREGEREEREMGRREKGVGGGGGGGAGGREALSALLASNACTCRFQLDSDAVVRPRS